MKADEGEEGGCPGRSTVIDAKYWVNVGLRHAINAVRTCWDTLMHNPEPGKPTGIVDASDLLPPTLPAAEPSYGDASMPERPLCRKYRSSFHLEAIALRPGMNVVDAGAVLRSVVADTSVV